MRKLTTLLLLAAALASPLILSACEEEGPAERAGESVDEVLEETGDEIDDATDN